MTRLISRHTRSSILSIQIGNKAYRGPLKTKAKSNAEFTNNSGFCVHSSVDWWISSFQFLNLSWVFFLFVFFLVLFCRCVALYHFFRVRSCDGSNWKAENNNYYSSHSELKISIHCKPLNWTKMTKITVLWHQNIR